MAIKITVRDGETMQSALRRFKKVVDRSNILRDAEKKECYEKPSMTKKREKHRKLVRVRLITQGLFEDCRTNTDELI